MNRIFSHSTFSEQLPPRFDNQIQNGMQTSHDSSLISLTERKTGTWCQSGKNTLFFALKIVVGMVIFPLGLYWLWSALTSSSITKIVDSLATTKPEILENFQHMCTEFEEEIFPHYIKHEQTFDKNYRIHSRMHVARSLLYCEVMGRIYHLQGLDVNFDLLRRAIGLHDAGRKGDGVDIWEKASAKILKKHLIEHGQQEIADQAQIIVKDDPNYTTQTEAYLAQSGDCLDIIRCFGPDHFRKNLLTFLNHNLEGIALSNAEKTEIRDQLIKEATHFIALTEKRKFNPEFSKNDGFMEALFEIIRQDPSQYPLLTTILPTG